MQRKDVSIVSFEFSGLRSCPSGQLRCQSCGVCSEVFDAGTVTLPMANSVQPSYELDVHLHERQHFDLIWLLITWFKAG